MKYCSIKIGDSTNDFTSNLSCNPQKCSKNKNKKTLSQTKVDVLQLKEKKVKNVFNETIHVFSLYESLKCNPLEQHKNIFKVNSFFIPPTHVHFVNMTYVCFLILGKSNS